MSDNLKTDRREVRLTDVDKTRSLTEVDTPRRRLVRNRPEPPRGVRFYDGVVYWDAPARPDNVTHYNVYINNETTHFAQVPSKQTSITGISASRVSISAYNANSMIESRKTTYNAAVWPAQPRVGGEKTHREIQAAIDALPVEGGEVFLAAGEWLIGTEGLDIPADKSGVRLVGSGEGTILKRKQPITSGKGVINVRGSNAVIADLCIDGDVTTSVGLEYTNVGGTGILDAGGGNGDPMWATLSDNTSIWVHSGVEGLSVRNVTITHTGGYSILLDALTDDVRNVDISKCRFINNRPHTFGSTGDTNYGSWTGGILYKCSGVSPSTSGVHNLVVEACTFRRCTGNCLWGHSNGFDAFHTNHVYSGNLLEDLGLDGIQPGNIVGCVVKGNSFRRVGYIHTTDVDVSAPAWRSGSYAVALDTTGYARNCAYIGNTFYAVNGGFIDTDGMFDSTISGNTLVNPISGEDGYVSEGLASYGLTENITKGIQTGATFSDAAGKNISILNNSIRGCGLSAIILAAARRCLVSGNNIEHFVEPDVQGVFGVPISIASTSASNSEKFALENTVISNRIKWDIDPLDINGAVPPANFCIIESDDISGSIDAGATVPGPNYVYDNLIIGNNYGEYLRGASATNSSARLSLPTVDDAATGESANVWQREGFGATAAMKIYKRVAGTDTQVAQLQDDNFLLNVSNAGTALTGNYATGDRTTVAFNDTMATGHSVMSAFLAARDKDNVGATYSDADANLLDDTWALIRFNKAIPQWEESVSTSGGNRVWAALGSSGSAPAGGSDTHVQYNSSGSLAGSANFAWDNTNQVLTITGVTTTAGVHVDTAYIDSAEGFLTASIATNAIQAPSGGVTAQGIAALADTGAYNQKYNAIESIGGGVATKGLTVGYIGAYTAGGYINLDGFAASAVALASDSFTSKAQIYYRSDTSRVQIDAGGLRISGTNAAAALIVQDGYIDSDEGFFTDIVSQEAVKVTGFSGSGPGGVACRELNIYNADGGGAFQTVIDGSRNAAFLAVEAGTITGAGSGTVSAQNGFYTTSSANNAINVPNGGVTADIFSVDTGVFTSVAAPSGAAGQGKIWFDSTAGKLQGRDATGSPYDLDTAGGGGVTSLNSLTGALTIVGTTNRITVTPSAPNITLSTPQDIHTSAQPTFSAMALSSTADNALDMYVSGSGPTSGGGIQCRAISAFQAVNNAISAVNGGVNSSTGYWVDVSTQVIGTTGIFVGPSVDVAGDIDFGDELKRNGSVIVNLNSIFTGSAVDVSGDVDFGDTLNHNSTVVINAAREFIGTAVDVTGDVDFSSELRQNGLLRVNTSGAFVGASVDVAGDVDFGDELKRQGTVIISSGSVFQGAGALCGSSGVGCAGVNIYKGSGDPLSGASYDFGITQTLNSFPTQLVFKGGVLIGYTA